jgi:hypothetical protein
LLLTIIYNTLNIMQWTIPAYTEILKGLHDQYTSRGKGKRAPVINSAVKKITASSKEHGTPLPDDLPGVCSIHVHVCFLSF